MATGEGSSYDGHLTECHFGRKRICSAGSHRAKTHLPRLGPPLQCPAQGGALGPPQKFIKQA